MSTQTVLGTPMPVPGGQLLTTTSGPIAVTTPSGSTVHVMGTDEAAWYGAAVAAYLSAYHFSDHSDMADLDRLVFAELMVFRANTWMAQGSDYDRNPLTATLQTALRRDVKENSAHITQIKTDLGINKAARDRDAHESVGTYLVNLRARALAFQKHRNEQLHKALALFNELGAMVGAYDRSSPEERRKLGIESETDILDWWRAVAEPEYRRLDAHFRTHQQNAWIRDL